MMQPKYSIERYPLGWVLCGPQGIPASALEECGGLFPKDAVIDAGIIHHLRAAGNRGAVMCIVTKENSRKWREQITESLKTLSPQARWWKGFDVGTSSAAIFAVLCDDQWRHAANEMGEKSTPHDADDFGRCKRLMDAIPEWRPLLPKVGEKYPETKWPSIIARWDEIAAADPKTQTQILRSLEA